MVKILLITLLVAVSAVTAGAADIQTSVATADYELSLLSGYGVSHRGFGETRTQVQTWDAIARLGWFLSDELGKESWYRGRHQLLIELPYHLALDQRGRSMTGGYLLGSWKFTSLKRITPYLFAGGGVLFVDMGLPSMGTRLDFSYQGGSGVQYDLAHDLAVGLEYRYHHISNAGTASPNEPINSSKILFSITLRR